MWCIAIENCPAAAHHRGLVSWCCCLSSQSSYRQKRSHGTPAKEGTDEPTASPSGQHITSPPQHLIVHPQTEGNYYTEECFMQQALKETLEQCMRSEQLPRLSNLPQVCLLEHRMQPYTAEGTNSSVAAHVVCLQSGLAHHNSQAEPSLKKDDVGRYTWGTCTSAHLDSCKPVM